MKNHTIEFLILFGMIGLLTLLFINGLNQSIQNQDTMLCESAKVSGNIRYLEKCECYYQSQDIKCLQKGEK